MNYNKKLSFVFLSLLMLSVFAVSFASAATSTPEVVTKVGASTATSVATSVSNGIDEFIAILNPITNAMFGATSADKSDDAFITWMAFLLVLLVVFGVLQPLKIFGESTKGGWINGAIAVIIAWIGARFVPIEMLRAFTLGSQGLVGALFLIIPFIVVAALILKSSNTYVRRLLWVVYAVVIGTLWIKAYSSTGWNSFYWVYVAIILASIVAFSFDGTLQKFWNKAKAERGLAKATGVQIERQKAKINDLKTALGEAVDDTERAQIADSLKREKANLDALMG